jgi:hypothetical protein
LFAGFTKAGEYIDYVIALKAEKIPEEDKSI